MKEKLPDKPPKHEASEQGYFVKQWSYMLLPSLIFMAANWLYSGDNLIYDPGVYNFFSDRINTEKPETVFVGNSMVAANLNEELFTERTGSPSIKVAVAGTSSAVWYLMIKNQVLIADHKPKHIVVFFRNTYITDPKFRTTGEDIKYMDDYATADEPLLQELTYDNRFVERGMLASLFVSLHTNRERLKRRFINTVKYPPAQWIMGTDRDETDAAVDSAFAWSNMDPDMLTAAQIDEETETDLAAFDFQSRVEKSYLPAMIQLAKDNDVTLSFVRIKRRKVARGIAEPPRLKRYIADLEQYLDENEVNFFDYTYEPSITFDLYDVGDHLKYPEGANVMTELLAEDMMNVLKQE